MPRALLVLLFTVGVAVAETPQDRVKTHFTSELQTALRRMFEDRIAEHPDLPNTRQLKLNLDKQVEGMIPQAMSAFAPELTISDADASALLAKGPNDATNQEEIEKNRKLMDQSDLPKPAIVTLMLKQMDTEKTFSGWRLETLRRLTDGTVRQLKERGELK